MMRRGKIEDVLEVEEIFNQAKRRLKEAGVDQWQGPYPNGEDFLKDLKEKRAWVWEDDQGIYAFSCLSQGHEPSYERIQGAWQGPGPYTTIHRTAIHDRVTGQGVGTKVLKDLEKLASSLAPEIRIDTHKDNRAMGRLVEKLGYTYAGIIYVFDGTPRLAYEKKLGGDE